MSEKLTERTIALHKNCTLQGEILNLHTALTREANFTNSNFLKFDPVKYISLLYRE